MTAATRPRARLGSHACGSAWAESALAVLAGTIVMLALLWPAFGSYFFAENFFYLGQYRENGGHFWRAVFTPITGIFFRPVFVAASIPWHFVLPTEPFAYHCRNFAFAVLNLFLLHRVLLRLTASRAARGAALLFFAISKIHLTVVSPE
ncbi:MAG: hypothetical protein ABIR79_24530 [Candidatus Binatia bacterium]